jgi:hypothetical protein
MRCCSTKELRSSSIKAIILLSPTTLKGPFFLISLIPCDLTLPATMPENTRRKLAAKEAVSKCN